MSLAERGDSYAGFPRAELAKKASQACGSQAAERSWAVVIDFPGAPAASLGTIVAYLARTTTGWRFWYEWLPYTGAHAQGFLPEHAAPPVR